MLKTSVPEKTKDSAASADRGESPDSNVPIITTKERGDFLWKVVQRYDAYINATNPKASIVLTFNTFVFAAVVLKWNDIAQGFGPAQWSMAIVTGLLFISAASSLVSLWFGLVAVVPILNSPKDPKAYHSLVFFVHVAEFTSPSDYAKATCAVTDANLVEDLAMQAHTLAKIAMHKFSLLQWATRLIVFVQLPSFLMMLGMLLVVAFVKNFGGQQP